MRTRACLNPGLRQTPTRTRTLTRTLSCTHADPCAPTWTHAGPKSCTGAVDADTDADTHADPRAPTQTHWCNTDVDPRGCSKQLWRTQCRRRSPNVAVNCHSRMELRTPTARKSHPNFFAHCKRSTNMKKYKKTIIPNVQNTMRTQVTPMVSNYGKLLTKWCVSMSKHHVNAWFMYVWVKYFVLQNASNSNVQSLTSTSKKCHRLVQNTL